MASICSGCSERTTASSGVCRTCQSKLFHARKAVDEGKVLLDQAGGAWWVWDRKGNVLVVGKDSKQAAIRALAFGDPDAEDGRDRSTRRSSMVGRDNGDLISKGRAESIRARIRRFEQERERHDPKRFQRGGSYEPAEYAAIARRAGVRRPTNEELGRLERRDFMTNPPEHLFAYYGKNADVGEEISTWAGNKLGIIVERGKISHPFSGSGKVVHVVARGYNGHLYSGRCNLSSGTYCRLRRGKRWDGK